MFAISHVLILVRVDEGGQREMPALLTEHGLFLPLVRYFIHVDPSPAKSLKIRHYVAEMLRYWSVNRGEKPVEFFRKFKYRWQTGAASSESVDTNLGWKAQSFESTNNCIRELTAFFDYLVASNSDLIHPNPLVKATSADRAIIRVAEMHKRSSALLGHLWDGSTRNTVRDLRGIPTAAHVSSSPRFPDDRFEELLASGFKTRLGNDYRGMAMTLLMHGGGLRASELFHLYIDDVFDDPINPDSAFVRICHPALSAPPDCYPGKYKNRAELLKAFDLQPRHQSYRSDRAGFKGAKYETEAGRYCFAVHWFEPEFGVLFKRIWCEYLARIVGIHRNHPYAFINLDCRSGDEGAPLKQDRFNKSHQAAVRRIGLAVKKELGTTLHGHRHAYGARLRKANLDPLIIQRVMHHRSILSQQVYTTPDLQEIGRQLDVASQALNAKPKRWDWVC
jgi:hypothetical protein